VAGGVKPQNNFEQPQNNFEQTCMWTWTIVTMSAAALVSTAAAVATYELLKRRELAARTTGEATRRRLQAVLDAARQREAADIQRRYSETQRANFF